jgi:hypothetical protein
VVHFRDDVYTLDAPKMEPMPEAAEPEVTATSSMTAKQSKM